MDRNLVLRAALAALIIVPAAACGPEPAVQTTTTATTPKPAFSTGPRDANGVLDDDPSGLRSGKVQPLKPPPPPLSAAQVASGQEVGQDLAAALGEDEQMDMYAVSLDKGNGIVATGGGNYALLETGATTAATPKPSPTPTPKASATPTPKPSEKARRTPQPSLAPKFVARLDALREEAKAAKLLARAQLLAARLTQRAQKLPEAKAVKAAAAAAAWSANLDGTFSKHFTVAISKTVGGKAASGTLEVQATVDDGSDTLVHHLARKDLTLPKTSRSVTRELVVAADGSRHISFHLEEWDAAGRKRVVDFSKTLDLEGGLSGTGSATRYDADGNTLRSYSVTFSGTEDAPALKALDANSKLEANVSLDTDGVAAAQVRDSATASESAVKVDPDGAPQDEAVADPAATP